MTDRFESQARFEDDIEVTESVPLLEEENQQNDKTVTNQETDEQREAREEEEIQTTSIATVFISLYVGMFLSALDSTIVATLLSHIASDFNQFKLVSWIATAYMISLAAIQPVYGKLSDIFGRKPLLQFCNIVFGIGSVLCGIAPNMTFLIFARLIAGCGGGGLWSLTSIVLTDIVPLRQRGVLQGIGNIVYGSGAALGGVVGGLVAQTVGWRWAFIVQGPIILLAIIAVQLNLPALKQDENVDIKSKLRRIDFAGSLSLFCTLSLFLLAISIGGNFAPWFSLQVILSLVFSAIFCCIFIYIELYIAAEPIIPLEILKNRTVLGSCSTANVMNMIYYAHLYYMAIYYISVRGSSPTNSGSSLIPMFGGNSLGSLTAGQYMRSTGRYTPIARAGNFVMLLATTSLVFIGKSTSSVYIFGGMFFSGFGYGILGTVNAISLVAAVPIEKQAVATSLQYVFKACGSTIGIAIAAAVYQNVLSHELFERITGPGADEFIDRIKQSMDEISRVPIEYRTAVIESYLMSSRAVFFTAVIFSITCFGTQLLCKEYALHNKITRR
ncbi:major facilitator superfamily domain-containing protein [Dipodascopsis uninucleata]